MIFESKKESEMEDFSKIPTGQIISQIRESPTQFSEKKLDFIAGMSFDNYLGELMKKYHCTPGRLIIRTCLSKPFIYQVLRGERTPGRDMVLRISLALKATVEETQKLLTLAQKGILYPKIKRDAAILCCIEAKKSLEDTNLFLEEHGEKKLL